MQTDIMLSSFLSGAYNYQHQENQHLMYPSTLNIPQFTCNRHPTLHPMSTSSPSVPTTSSTMATSPGNGTNIKEEPHENQSPQEVANSTIKFSINNILGLTPDGDGKCADDDVDDDDETSQTSPRVEVKQEESHGEAEESPRFPWLQCSRYKPPKLPRLKKKDGVKRRKLGRNPRVPFTQHQVAVLEEKFRRTHYLSSMDVAELSTALNLSDNRVKIWFQNRRARERRDLEAARASNLFSQSPTQPLMVPSVTWPLPSNSPTSTFAHIRSAFQQGRGGFVPSAFSLYLPRTQGQETGSMDTSSDRPDKF